MNKYDKSYKSNQKIEWNKYWANQPIHTAKFKHNKLAEDFLRLSQQYIYKDSNLVCDLGCGRGQDSIFFAQNDLLVDAVDFSESALLVLNTQLKTLSLSAVSTYYHNIENILPFKNCSYKGVYSHLGLHYFKKSALKSIFNEIYRILLPGGFLMFSVKSTSDFSYGMGTFIEPNMYDYNGHIRHFYNQDLVLEVLHGWDKIVINEYTTEESLENHYNGHFIKVIASKHKEMSVLENQ